MMHELPQNINKIIARILSGEAHVDDILAFNKWLNEGEHWEEFLYLKSFWESDTKEINTNKISSYPEIVYEKRIQKALDNSSHNSEKKRRIYLFSLVASVFLLLGMSTAFFFFSKTNPPIQYYTYLSTEGTTEFNLADGTHVILNQNSRLTFTSEYGKKERTIHLEGEAYFNVKKNPEQIFTVTMNNSSIQVFGTKFNVNAYSNNENVVATLEEGLIRFQAEDQQTMLTPNQQLVYHRATGKMDVVNVNPELFLAWKDNMYRYHSITMDDLGKELEKIYDVEILVAQRWKDIKVSGTFVKDQLIDEVLQIMQKSLAFQYSKKEDKIIIR